MSANLGSWWFHLRLCQSIQVVKKDFYESLLQMITIEYSKLIKMHEHTSLIISISSASVGSRPSERITVPSSLVWIVSNWGQIDCEHFFIIEQSNPRILYFRNAINILLKERIGLSSEENLQIWVTHSLFRFVSNPYLLKFLFGDESADASFSYPPTDSD